MPRRISAKEHEYAGARLKPGDEFECEAKDLPFMLADGRIQADVEAQDAQQYMTRDLAAARRGRPRTRA